MTLASGAAFDGDPFVLDATNTNLKIYTQDGANAGTHQLKVKVFLARYGTTYASNEVTFTVTITSQTC